VCDWPYCTNQLFRFRIADAKTQHITVAKSVFGKY